MPFGVMGGQYQAVGHATFLHRLLDRGMDPQQAAEAPRVFAYQGVLQVEHFVPEPIRDDLAKRGHIIEMLEVPIGGCQAIWIDWRARRADRRLRAAQGRSGARVLSSSCPSGAERSEEPGTHAHGRIRKRTADRASWARFVFMGSGLAAAQRPGMTIENTERRTAATVHGAAEIGFAQKDGKTRLTHLYQRNPMRVLFPEAASRTICRLQCW